MKNFHLNKQSKYILIELIIGTIVITFIAMGAINRVQNKTDKTYADFAQLVTKTVAAEVADLSRFYPDTQKKLLADKFEDFLAGNEDVSYIEYKDTNNNLIYSSKKNIPVKDDEILLSVSSPIIINNNIIGSVTIGMTGKGIIPVSKEVNKSLFGIFFLTWAFFAGILILNIFLISKELTKLYEGVKEITSGKFGYNVKPGNMSELTNAFNDMSNILSKYDEKNLEQLTLERNKLEAVLMNIINGVIVCNNYDNVVLANSAALKMLDIDENNLLNKKIQDYIDSHGEKCFSEKIEEFKETPINILEQQFIEFIIEAGKLTIKAVISPMFLNQRDYVGYIIVLIDITRETEVNKLKNTFISNVSHELRTPVTVLRTYIDTLYNNGSDFDEETKKEFMKTIDTEAKRLHSMVNDILDFSRLESGKIELHKEYANISDLLIQNINSIKILAEEKNIKINFKEIGEVPKIPINIESMDRVIRNLLSNAIKYSLNGKDIEVFLKLSEDKKNVEFSIKDNGIGIAKEHLEKIFDRFYRIENATHTIKGTGLGLHLVKMTVEKYHNGKITVQSKENEGSTFTVFLPVTVNEDELV